MKENIKDFISLDIDENMKYIKELFKDCSDIVHREFYVGKYKAATVYFDGMADKLLLDNFVLESLMIDGKYVEDVKDIKDRLLTVTDVKAFGKLSEAINLIMAGETMMLIEGIDSCYIIATRAFPTRGVGEPAQETVIRGGRDSFTEVVRFNTALLRRRVRDTRLKLEGTQVGTRSKTDCVITYIDDVVNSVILDELKSRLKKINIDAVLDSGYIEQYIEDDFLSPFPQVQSTERPDVVAAALYEGRVAILVDNSPLAIIVPSTLPNLFQSPDDYYQRWIYGSITRILRLIAVFISLVSPAVYVAATSFNPSIIPTKLAYSIAVSREGVPFPAFIEALIMEVSLALLTEATIRLPKAIGSTIGIVGGLIIGQAAVSAGIVSPIMIIVVSITVLASFAIPNYQAGNAIRIIRFFTIIASAIIGLYGIMLVLIIMLIHLVRLKSFGVPYLAPAVNTSKSDLKDLILRFPFKFMKERPDYMSAGDKLRQR